MNKKVDPKIHVTDKRFVYVPAVKTDVLETFKRYGWVPPSKLKEERDARR